MFTLSSALPANPNTSTHHVLSALNGDGPRCTSPAGQALGHHRKAGPRSSGDGGGSKKSKKKLTAEQAARARRQALPYFVARLQNEDEDEEEEEEEEEEEKERVRKPNPYRYTHDVPKHTALHQLVASRVTDNFGTAIVLATSDEFVEQRVRNHIQVGAYWMPMYVVYVVCVCACVTRVTSSAAVHLQKQEEDEERRHKEADEEAAKVRACCQACA